MPTDKRVSVFPHVEPSRPVLLYSVHHVLPAAVVHFSGQMFLTVAVQAVFSLSDEFRNNLFHLDVKCLHCHASVFVLHLMTQSREGDWGGLPSTPASFLFIQPLIVRQTHRARIWRLWLPENIFLNENPLIRVLQKSSLNIRDDECTADNAMSTFVPLATALHQKS